MKGQKTLATKWWKKNEQNLIGKSAKPPLPSHFLPKLLPFNLIQTALKAKLFPSFRESKIFLALAIWIQIGLYQVYAYLPIIHLVYINYWVKTSHYRSYQCAFSRGSTYSLDSSTTYKLGKT